MLRLAPVSCTHQAHTLQPGKIARLEDGWWCGASLGVTKRLEWVCLRDVRREAWGCQIPKYHHCLLLPSWEQKERSAPIPSSLSKISHLTPKDVHTVLWQIQQTALHSYLLRNDEPFSHPRSWHFLVGVLITTSVMPQGQDQLVLRGVSVW